jgi:hypothetical protein
MIELSIDPEVQVCFFQFLFAAGAAAKGAAAAKAGAAAKAAVAAKGAVAAEGAGAVVAAKGVAAAAATEIAATEGAAAQAATAVAAQGAGATAAEGAAATAVQTPIPPAVQAMLEPEALQVSQAPTVDFGANLSTPTGPTRVTESFPTVPRGTSTPPDRGLIDRLNQGIQRVILEREKFKKTEPGQLIENVQELQRRFPSGRVQIPQISDQAPPEQAIPQTVPHRVPQLSRAQTVPLRGSRDLGLAGGRTSFATTRSEAISELLAELRLNRRSFG